MQKKTDPTRSRRDFLETTAAGAVVLSTGMLPASADEESRRNSDENSDEYSDVGSLRVLSAQSIPKLSTADLRLRFRAGKNLVSKAKLWLFFDIRQGAATGQTLDPDGENFVTIRRTESEQSVGEIHVPPIPRTLDLLPVTPEFLHLVELTLNQPIAEEEELDIVIRRWTGPRQPIDPYRFWLVVDHAAKWDFVPIGFRRYRKFVSRGSEERVKTEDLRAQMTGVSIRVSGEYEAVPKISYRATPGIYWGEFHGMVFNQRPLDDYYNYAKQVTRLDFCAPFGFSYMTCIGGQWNEVKAAANRHTEPGKFLAIAGFECGTPPDGSHRCIVFRDPKNVPPIFCEDRPPAQEPFFQDRLDPDTIVCKTTEELYQVVAEYGGLITGHFHTRTYHNEILCEMFQKNLTKPDREEERLYELLRSGKRFALAGTSDTHDSMPGNPRPEPHLPMAAGFTGVHASELTADAIFDAVLARRVFATSGARISMRFHSNSRPMGAELPLGAPREFQIEIAATADLERVELLRDGRPIQEWNPNDRTFSMFARDSDADSSEPAFYHVRVTQIDSHRGWTTPIWFG